VPSIRSENHFGNDWEGLDDLLGLSEAVGFGVDDDPFFFAGLTLSVEEIQGDTN